MKNLDVETLRVYGYVYSSSYRTNVLKSLGDGSFEIPSVIAKNSGIRQEHISKVLKQLKDAGVVECMNEEAIKGRIYRLTDLGKTLVKYFD